jgi:streptomycin 6-kinase
VKVLYHYNGNGAVRVLRFADGATLLERAKPGTHLSRIGDEEATRTLCEVIDQLHSNKNLLELPNIAKLQQGFTTYLAGENKQIPFELVAHANATYVNLLNSQDNPIVLHGDLHHDNVLFDQKRGWLAIDPKGYIGEPTFEVGAMLRNPKDNVELLTTPAVISLELTSSHNSYTLVELVFWIGHMRRQCWQRFGVLKITHHMNGRWRQH